MQVRDAPTRPEVADHGIGLAADQAWRATAEPTKSVSGILNNRGLTRQIIRGDKLSDAGAKLLVGHCHRFAVASSRAMTMASTFRSSRIALHSAFQQAREGVRGSARAGRDPAQRMAWLVERQPALLPPQRRGRQRGASSTEARAVGRAAHQCGTVSACPRAASITLRADPRASGFTRCTRSGGTPLCI